MNRLGLARQTIVDAVATVLPGRVDAFPPTKVQRGLAPLAWIDTPALDPETIGLNTNIWMAVFPLHLVVDGATHSQCALLDDLVGQVVDVIESTPGLSARHVEPGDVFVDTSQVLRGAVVDVAATITARTFCVPEPSVVAVPPEPVPITV